MGRCIDETIGVKVLSHDLLQDAEKAQLDAHLAACDSCRDLLAQTYGKEGALDELAARVFRLSRRQRVPAHAWVAERLRDLWVPFLLIAMVVGVGMVLVTRSRDGAAPVKLLRFAVSRAGMLDSAAVHLAPRVDPVVASVLLRPDRHARVHVYESHAGAMRRLIPGQSGAPLQIVPDSTSEITLPPPSEAAARILLVLVPSDAAGTIEEWDAAVLGYLGGTQRDRGWPGAMPTLRWLP